MKYWIAIGLILVLLQFTVFFGPPYVPTLRKPRQKALKLLSLKPGQILIDLGSGDGSLLKEAAIQGIVCIGYELNPLLALIALLRTWKYRDLVSIKVQNIWNADISQADGIYIFLAGKYMAKFDNFLKAKTGKKKVKVVSYGFQIPNRRPQTKADGFYLYKYP